MRTCAAILLLTAAATGEAQASSFVVMEPMKESLGPSMVFLGAPAQAVAGPAFPSITIPSGSSSGAVPSIIALGAPPPAVSNEHVAALPESAPKKASSMGQAPMVIRGGLVGEAYVRPAPAGAPEASEPAAVPMLDPNDKGTSAKRKALKEQEARQQEQAAAPAAPEPVAPELK